MPGRLIVLSNRIPLSGPPAGGLVFALDALLAQRGGLWIGAADEPDPSPDGTLTPVPCDRGYDKATFGLTEEEIRDYYLGYANSVLWPLCHHRPDLLALDRSYIAAYRAVNARVARMIADMAGPEDLVWIHDYHFLPIAYELRKLGVTLRIGFFLHIPFPTLIDLAALSEQRQFHEWLAAFDLVGLQTEADVRRCLEAFSVHPKAELWFDGRIKLGARVFDLRSFPIGIDVEGFSADARAPLGQDPLHLPSDARLVVGVDRLDYSKGIPNRLRGFGNWLERRAEDGPRATLLQICPPSRAALRAYKEITRELEALTGHLNGRHGSVDWTPIRCLHRGLDRTFLAPLFRLAAVGLVTPLADGMNLVAKEYVAAQDEDDPGVLILSRAAGAAEQMTDALIVNPYDADEVGEAIEQALCMPLSERRARHAGLMDVVRNTDINDWGETFLRCLAAVDPVLPRRTRAVAV